MGNGNFGKKGKSVTSTERKPNTKPNEEFYHYILNSLIDSGRYEEARTFALKYKDRTLSSSDLVSMSAYGESMEIPSVESEEEDDVVDRVEAESLMLEDEDSLFHLEMPYMKVIKIDKLFPQIFMEKTDEEMVTEEVVFNISDAIFSLECGEITLKEFVEHVQSELNFLEGFFQNPND